MSQPVTEATEEYTPQGVAEALDHATALPVRIVREPGEKVEAAEHVSWWSVILTGAEPPAQLLTFSRKRGKAIINIAPAVGAVGTQYVRLGRANQASANGGALYAAPVSIPYSAQPEVWVIPQAVNGAVIIAVEEERYA